MNKDISPEERLFNTIQDGKKSPPRRGSEKVIETGQNSLWQKLFPGVKKDNSAPVVPLTQTASEGLKLNVQLINRILISILIILILWVCYKAIYERPDITDVMNSAQISKHSESVFIDAVEEFKPLDTYLEEVKKKDIFHPVAADPEPVVVAEPDIPVEIGPDIKELMKNLSLAGIYEGQNIEAMIEDKELKKTYFVKPGDEIKGIKVKEVLKDRVILQMGTQEADLL